MRSLGMLAIGFLIGANLAGASDGETDLRVPRFDADAADPFSGWTVQQGIPDRFFVRPKEMGFHGLSAVQLFDYAVYEGRGRLVLQSPPVGLRGRLGTRGAKVTVYVLGAAIEDGRFCEVKYRLFNGKAWSRKRMLGLFTSQRKVNMQEWQFSAHVPPGTRAIRFIFQPGPGPFAFAFDRAVVE